MDKRLGREVGVMHGSMGCTGCRSYVLAFRLVCIIDMGLMVMQVNTFSYIWLASEALSYLQQAQGEKGLILSISIYSAYIHQLSQH